MPAATVVIRNNGTQATRNAVTDSAGFYSVTELPIGTYVVEVEQKGFRRQQRTNITVAADAKLTVDFHLVIGDLTQDRGGDGQYWRNAEHHIGRTFARD